MRKGLRRQLLSFLLLLFGLQVIRSVVFHHELISPFLGLTGFPFSPGTTNARCHHDYELPLTYRCTNAVFYRWLDIEWIPPFSFNVDHIGCDKYDKIDVVETVVCHLTDLNAPAVKHPAHLLQTLTACWSSFQQYPHAQRLISIPSRSFEKDLFKSAWTSALSEPLNFTVIIRENYTYTQYQPVVVATPARIRPGWKELGLINRPFMNPKDAKSFRDAVVHASPELKLVRNSSPRLNVGIMNRKDSRVLLNTSAIIRSLRVVFPLSRIVENSDMGELSPIQQAMWVNSMDVIISPHGQQLMSVAFIRQCAAVIEVYPVDYTTPGYFLPYVVALNGVAVGLNEGRSLGQDMDKIKIKENRVKIRARNITLREEIVEAFQFAVREKGICCRDLARSVSYEELIETACL